MSPALARIAFSMAAAILGFSFKNALAVEKIHHDLYSQALATLKSGRDLPTEIMAVLSANLDSLHPAEVRTATQLGIDTGRRPEDILNGCGSSAVS